jgi:hypothetical protein
MDQSELGVARVQQALWSSGAASLLAVEALLAG